MSKVLVTGSSGLIGSEVSEFFLQKGISVFGIENNTRADFFGPSGDTRFNQKRLQTLYPSFNHIELDIRDRSSIVEVVKKIKPDLVVHTAAQPSHDLAAKRPFDDFDVNAGGTLNLLEAVRRDAPSCVFVHMSTNKVYGDRPNFLGLVEQEKRWDFSDHEYKNGIGEDMSIDQSKHSLFGASKVAADILVQEYGRYFGIATCCLRGGCLTGPNHAGVELHGFLNYLVKCNLEGREYKIFGYKGKQVRDNIHSLDVARFIEMFWKNPKIGAVYNIGGGRANSVSILEAFELTEHVTGRKMRFEYLEGNRDGDHICYISNLAKIRNDYPDWNVTIGLEQIVREIAASHENGK